MKLEESDPNQIKKAAEIIKQSKQPIIVLSVYSEAEKKYQNLQ